MPRVKTDRDMKDYLCPQGPDVPVKNRKHFLSGNNEQLVTDPAVGGGNFTLL